MVPSRQRPADAGPTPLRAPAPAASNRTLPSAGLGGLGFARPNAFAGGLSQQAIQNDSSEPDRPHSGYEIGLGCGGVLACL